MLNYWQGFCVGRGFFTIFYLNNIITNFTHQICEDKKYYSSLSKMWAGTQSYVAASVYGNIYNKNLQILMPRDVTSI